MKARDSHGAESGWSETRHFSIEAPNKPPTINFKTANGNGDSRITTSERNWTFVGTAGDPEGRFSRVEFRCDDCDNSGSGGDRSNSTNWSISRNGMSGRNYVTFLAYDDKQSTKSRTLELNIDLAAPSTGIQINGKPPDAWPAYFTVPAEVRLTGRDNGTGRAVAGEREVRHRRDGGDEQVQPGSTANFTESSDGEHTVTYYSVDNVGNVEGQHTATYRVDRTPPTGIGGLQESSGVVSDQWQKAQNQPTFTWNPSSDAFSGLGGYQFYFGPLADGTAVHFDVGANDPLTLTPSNLGVATGIHYLRGRTWDKAGNSSAWQTLFILKYDGTPPPNPAQATHVDGAKNDVWQRITASANFTWTRPIDEGSGLKGYLAYWGANEDGESTTFIGAENFQSGAPLCAAGEACTGYLRLRSQDNVDLQAEDWSTVFVLRYDGAPPVADFTVNSGVTQTNQTLVQLSINAVDQGSGLYEMRLSGDGEQWTPWEVYAEERVWEIPGISRQSWPIYLQVKDAVGWESAVVSRTVYLDVNVVPPHSENYRLFDWTEVSGAGAHTSQPTGYQGHSTVGQVMDSPASTSVNFTLAGGYEAGSQAIPLLVPGHDEFEFVNGIFASGVINVTMQSAGYQMIGIWGEPALPNNTSEIASGNYRHQPGFLAARPPLKGTPTPGPMPTPGPTPTPTPAPDCEFPRVSINGGDVFTSDTDVTLSLCAPKVTEMMISNDGGFDGAQWQPYARSRAWTLTSHSNYVLPRYVYVAFRDAGGQVYASYMDDIILDPAAPEARVRIGSNLPLEETAVAAARSQDAELPSFQAQGIAYVQRIGGRLLAEPLPLLRAGSNGSVDLYLSARDNVGNVKGMELSEDGSFSGAWVDYQAYTPWTPSAGDGIKTVYARFQDEAGNASQPYTATFALDTLPPVGGIALSHPILGPDVVTTTVWLGAEDNLSGVAAMRLSTDASFNDAVWQSFADSVTWVYGEADRSRSDLHVQYRDYAGNESEIYSASLLTDTTPPLVYIEVEPGDTLTRTLQIYSYDELSYPGRMQITNDPLFLEGVTTQPYVDMVEWTFDERQVVWVRVQDSVGNWSEPYPAYAELPFDQQTIDLSGGWNLNSFAVEPANPARGEVLQTIDGNYSWILGDGLLYDPSLEPPFNTLNELHAGEAYYIHATDADTLTIGGERVPVTTSLALEAGWNWIGYLPDAPLPVEQALASIAGKYQRILSITDTFEAALPEHSYLTTLSPGQGYLIHMSEPAALVYPQPELANASTPALASVTAGCRVSPTPALTLVYGEIRLNGEPAPIGTKVEAMAKSGEVAGCFIVQKAGQFGLMHVYGEWRTGETESTLLKAGDEIAWRINGATAQGDTVLQWQNDLTPHSLILDGATPPLYLPWINGPGRLHSASETTTEQEQIFLPYTDR